MTLPSVQSEYSYSEAAAGNLAADFMLLILSKAKLWVEAAKQLLNLLLLLRKVNLLTVTLGAAGKLPFPLEASKQFIVTLNVRWPFFFHLYSQAQQGMYVFMELHVNC